MRSVSGVTEPAVCNGVGKKRFGKSRRFNCKQAKGEGRRSVCWLLTFILCPYLLLWNREVEKRWIKGYADRNSCHFYFSSTQLFFAIAIFYLFVFFCLDTRIILNSAQYGGRKFCQISNAYQFPRNSSLSPSTFCSLIASKKKKKRNFMPQPKWFLCLFRRVFISIFIFIFIFIFCFKKTLILIILTYR